MYNYKALISYDGYDYYGFQKQGSLDTIELRIEKAFLFYGFNVKIISSGRTDKGVHAINQVINFTLEKNIKPCSILYFLNQQLPSSIQIKSVESVNLSFHARYSVIAKEYLYCFKKTPLTPFDARYSVYIKDLDFDLMKKAAMLFLGTHDFRAFCKLDFEKNTIRTILDISFIEDVDYIKFLFKGDGFLKYQVRRMVGLLINIGLRKLDIFTVTKMLTTKDYTLSTLVANPCGLYLFNVYY